VAKKVASTSLHAPFSTTVWTNVVKAQVPDPEAAREGLGHLIERYWKPVYHFLRQKGRSRDDAADLTQQFFAEFLAKDVVSYADKKRGRFRTFLLASVTRFLIDAHRVSARKPVMLPLIEGEDPEERRQFEPCGGEAPEQAFDRNWARMLVHNCVARLREECEVLRKVVQFKIFTSRFLSDGPPPDRRKIASDLGISEIDVDNHLRAAKKRYGRILREEVAGTVLTQEETDQEIHKLMSILSETSLRAVAG
jgi:RNA polymerase sigma factor (sigma-70 family)